MTEYKSWQQREAEAKLTNAQAEQANVAAQAAKVELAGAEAAAATRKLAEQVKQQRLQQQMAEQHDTATERAQARRQARAENRAEAGTDFKRLVKVFVGVCMASALPAQFRYFLGLHKAGEAGTAWLLGPLPVVLELAAWVAVLGTSWAGRKGMSKIPFWALTAVLAGFAAWVNYRHGTAEYGSIAGSALAAASFAGPLMWELAEWLDGLAAVETRSREQRATDKAAAARARAEAKAKAEHDAKRAKADPRVWARFQMILIAHPLGTLDEETAWRQAWDDVHRAPLGVTALTYAGRVAAERQLESVMGEERSVYRELDAFLGDIFGGDDEGGIGGLPDGPSGKPSDGPSQARGGLVRKGKQPSAVGSQKTPQRPLEPEHIGRVRKLAEALGGKDKLSVRNVREAIGGGSTEYAIRLRDAVKKERATGSEVER